VAALLTWPADLVHLDWIKLLACLNSMVSSGLYSKEAVDKSKANAESMAKLNEKLTKDLITFQDNVQKYAVGVSAQLTDCHEPIY